MTWLGQGIIFDTSPDIEPKSRHKYQIDIKQKKVSTKPTFHLTKEAKRPNKRLSRKTFCLNINFFIKILHVETDNCSPPVFPNGIIVKVNWSTSYQQHRTTRLFESHVMLRQTTIACFKSK